MICCRAAARTGRCASGSASTSDQLVGPGLGIEEIHQVAGDAVLDHLLRPAPWQSPTTTQPRLIASSIDQDSTKG